MIKGFPDDKKRFALITERMDKVRLNALISLFDDTIKAENKRCLIKTHFSPQVSPQKVKARLDEILASADRRCRFFWKENSFAENNMF